MGVSYRFQCTVIVILLLHWLLYGLLFILIEIITYLYDFERVKAHYHHFFKERSVLNFLKMFHNYAHILLKMCWRIFSNTSGNMLKILTNKNGANFP